MSETRNYKGYSMFDDVENKELQAYNRAVAMRNINTDLGKEDVKEYCHMLTMPDKLNAVRELAKIAGMA
jgi:hypothetical protein